VRRSFWWIAALFLAALFVVGAWAWLRSTGNFHAVVKGAFYRSAQPTMDQLTRWCDEFDLATVLVLRDDSNPHLYREEEATVEAAGARFVHGPISDRALPKRLDLLELVRTIETAPKPMLTHCRVGADRSGLASVIAAMALGGQTYEQARGQLSLKFLHVREDPQAVEGVLTKYEAYCKRHGLERGGWSEFRRWIVEHYSDAYYLIDIDAPARIQAHPDEMVSVELTVHNETDVPIPADDPTKTFSVASYLGTAADLVPEREFGPRTPLKQVVPAEGSVRIRREFWPPQEPGDYQVHFDVIEEGVAWFAAEGSPEPTYELVVQP
jgi:protein tyrosine phosphatase (PTP) superfamily phosphohydrolase (DUF442 family)